MKLAEAQKARAFKKREAQEKVIALVASGSLVKHALAAVGRSTRAYEDWRKSDRDFARKVDLARVTAGGLKGGLATPGVEFVPFRKLYFDRDTPAHHYRMIEAVERAAPDTVSLILAFPEAAKSSLLTDRINYLLGTDPNFRIAVISEGRDLATKIVGQVAQRMTDESQFKSYIERFGPFKAPDREQRKPWNANFLSVLRASNDEKDYSLEARGAGSALYGGRFDEIHLDDMQSDKNLGQTAKLLTYMRQTVLTRPAKGVGKTFVWGSRVGDADIYEKMLDEGMVDRLVKIPALTVPVRRGEHFTVDRDGKVELVEGVDEITQSAWPEWWSLLDLAKRRKLVGEEIWARTYMQEPVYFGNATFADHLLEDSKDRTRGLGRNGLGVDLMCSVDPALDSGTCAFMAAAYSADRLWPVDCLERGDIYGGEDILSQIAAWSAVYRPSAWLIEQNAYQKSLVRDQRLVELANRFGFQVIPHTTNRNKLDPVLGIARMDSTFVDHMISIPWGDDEAVKRFGPLLDELRAWRPMKSGVQLKQNLVVALWFIWIRWEQDRQSMAQANARLWRPSWMVA